MLPEEGDKEEKTRNPLSATVGDRVYEQHDRHQFTTDNNTHAASPPCTCLRLVYQ